MNSTNVTGASLPTAMSHQKPAAKVYMRTKTKNTNQPVEVLPSTSKELNKIEDTNKKCVSLPHIIPLPSNGQDVAVKLIQVSPLKSLPKDKIPKLIKIAARPIPKPHLSHSGHVRLLKPVKNVPVASSKVSGPVLEILPLTPEKKCSVSVTGDSSTTSVSNTTNQTSENLLCERKVPSILQKKALLDTALNKPGNKQITTKQTTLTSETEKVLNQKVINAEEKSTPAKNIEENLTKQSKPPPVKKNRERQMLKSPNRNNMPKNKEKDTKDLTEETLYIADGFQEDAENLVDRCLQVYKLNFDKFTDIWKEMNFPCIFYGRQSSAELAELSEEVIHLAKGHMLAKNVSFEQNVAGLFLVYALLNHQPFSGFASLRLTPGDAPLLLALEAEARSQKRHDVLYVLGHVLIKGPCQFHVKAREVSLEVPLKKYFDGSVQVKTSMDSVFSRNAECVPLFNELIAEEQRYESVRRKLLDQASRCKRPASMLLELYRGHIPRGRNSERNPEELINEILSTSKPEEDRSDLLKSIKERAMATAVDPMKHLTGIDERQQDNISSSSDESEIESKPAGRKTRVKGKGRSSATTLQELFGSNETETPVFIPETSTKEMPTLDLLDDNLASKKPNNQTDKKIPAKKPCKKPEDDSNQSNNKRKRKNITDGPTAKRKVPKNDKTEEKDEMPNLSKPDLDLINITDLIPVENTQSNLDMLYEFSDDVNIANTNNMTITETMFDNFQQSFNRGTNNDMSSIAIEIERLNDDTSDTMNEDINSIYKDTEINAECEKADESLRNEIKYETDSESRIDAICKKDAKSLRKEIKDKTDPKSRIDADYKKSDKTLIKEIKSKTESKSSRVSKDVSNNNTISNKDSNKVKSPKKAAKMDKNISDNKNTSEVKTKSKKDITKPKLNTKKSKSPSPEKFNSPTRRKKSAISSNKSPKMSSPELSSPMKKRGSPRLSQKSPRSESTKPIKRKNTSSEGDDDIFITKKPKARLRGMNLRVKSSFKKLGILEVYDSEGVTKK